MATNRRYVNLARTTEPTPKRTPLPRILADHDGYDPYGTPPNPYRAATEQTVELTPDLDKHYDPYGVPADGYRIGLAKRQLDAEAEAERKEKK